MDEGLEEGMPLGSATTLGYRGLDNEEGAYLLLEEAAKVETFRYRLVEDEGIHDIDVMFSPASYVEVSDWNQSEIHEAQQDFLSEGIDFEISEDEEVFHRLNVYGKAQGSGKFVPFEWKEEEDVRKLFSEQYEDNRPLVFHRNFKNSL